MDAFGVALAILVGVSIFVLLPRARNAPAAVGVPNAFGWVVAIALIAYLAFVLSGVKP